MFENSDDFEASTSSFVAAVEDGLFTVLRVRNTFWLSPLLFGPALKDVSISDIGFKSLNVAGGFRVNCSECSDDPVSN